MKNKKILIITFILVLVISIFGISFALYTYNKTSSNSKLIVGDIYMHYKESNEAILTTAEDTSRFYYNGYLVNSVMASQEYQTLPDNRNELSKCVDYFNKYPGRFQIFHVKDHREIGQSGMVGFDAIFKNAKTAGVNYLVAEIEKYSVPVEESVEESLDYLLNAPFVKSSYAK